MNDLVYASTGGEPVNFGNLNGHQTVEFTQSGGTLSGSYALSTTPVRSQPTTQYIVIANRIHTGNRYSFDDGLVTIRNTLRCVNPSPNMRYTSFSSGVNLITNIPALNTFIVLTIVKQSGLNASSTQVNNNTPDLYTQASLLNDSGYILNTNTLLSAFTFLESKFAYIIVRQGADSVANQNKFINYLLNRFAL